MAGGNSYNGWPASDNPSSIGIDKSYGSKVGATAPTGGYAGGMKGGDVSTVFTYLINRLHNEVEPMMPENGKLGYGCWGYSYRANVNNPSTLSCHASGTAIDYNAPKHPNGTSTGPNGGGGWSGNQYNQIKAILSTIGVINWLTSNDPMHFEIKGNASQVAEAAKRLGSGGGTPIPPEPEKPKVPTLTEVGMFIVHGPGGARLCGPGYIKNLSGEEYDVLKKVPGMQVLSGNQREFDVAGAACTQGEVAQDVATSVWEEQLDSHVNPGTSISAEDMVGYIDEHTQSSK